LREEDEKWLKEHMPELFEPKQTQPDSTDKSPSTQADRKSESAPDQPQNQEPMIYKMKIDGPPRAETPLQANLLRERAEAVFCADLQERVKSPLYKEHEDLIPNLESLAKDAWDILPDCDTVVCDEASKPVGEFMGTLIDLARAAEGFSQSKKIVLPVINPNTVIRAEGVSAADIGTSNVFVAAGQATAANLDAFCRQIERLGKINAHWGCLNPMGVDDESDEGEQAENIQEPENMDSPETSETTDTTSNFTPRMGNTFTSQHPSADQIDYLHYSRPTSRQESTDSSLVAHRVYAFLNEHRRKS